MSVGKSGNVDVVVIGAGAAGLGAAKALQTAGKRFVVLEAMDRAGGRAWTDSSTFGVPVDWGCHWLHSASINPMRQYADELGIAYLDRHVPWKAAEAGGRLFSESERDALMVEFDALYRAGMSAGERGIDVPLSDVVDASSPAYGLFESSVQAEWGFMPAEVSTLDAVRYRDTDENFAVRDGYGALLLAVASGIPTELNTPVKQVILDGNGVRVVTDRGAIEADSVIVSVSTNVLSRGLIDFQPGLPDWKLAAAAAVPLGSDNKVVLQVDSRHFGIDEHCSLRIPYPGAPWFNVQVRPFGREIVSIYMGGPISAELEAAGADAAIEAGRQALIDTFGTGLAGHIGKGAASAWGLEPSILGAYGAARPGQANLRGDLAKPVEDRIFFCGEATHPYFFSTCHGAWMSGERAAAEALAILS
ncbi:MAG: FAD-dependent oxidoreductase [Thermomicrobiales bacterium]|nr:FAD-dependent oxidoreductase [Thermomicrobiales bacterium]